MLPLGEWMGTFLKGSWGLTRWTCKLMVCMTLSACGSGKKFKETTNESSDEDRWIIGGNPVGNEQPLAKNVALLVNSMNHEVCTATLLGGPFALTAAHCIDFEKPENLYVFFTTKAGPNVPARQVVNVKASPLWNARQNESQNTGDLAVIRFAGSLPKGYEGIEFLPSTVKLENNLSTFVAGYGISNAVTQTGAGILRSAELKIGNLSFSNTEVLLDQNLGSGVCHGDSGGPAYLTINGKNYLWGIASRADDDEENLCNTYSVYTNVLLYQVWIINTMRTLLGTR